MKHYRIIDNHIPSRNVYVFAENKSHAMSEGASLLKTFNIHVIRLKKAPNMDKEREHRIMMHI